MQTCSHSSTFIPNTTVGNKPHLPWIVQKYGGTSVGKYLDTIATDIIPSYLEKNRVVIVCSARSGKTKELGTTKRLLKAAEEALKEGSTIHLDIVKELTLDHMEVARQYIQNQDILQQLESQLDRDCRRLRSFLQAAEIIQEISPRSRDVIVGMGETLSCQIVAALLKDKGIDSKFINLNNMIDKEFDNLNQEFYDYLATRLATIVEECGNKVPVLTGFFGNVPGSLLSTIGHGYTDLCAALTAVGLHANELHIWKEVDGIFTADPRKVEKARLLPIITPEEVAELTYYGSEVIHPFTMEQVIRVGIPIRIKNVENPAGSGTVIFPDLSSNKENNDSLPMSILAQNGFHSDVSKRSPTAVTIKDNICVLNVHSNRKNVSHGFLANIFTTLDEHGIVVDLISTSEVHVSMALNAEMVSSSLDIAVNELAKHGSVDVMNNMAILSLVGKHMKSTVGIAGNLFTALANANISIEIISQGASEINISCVVDGSNALEALNVVHEQLLIVDPSIDHHLDSNKE
ncbi:Aspartate/glutamate/uridylate kinase [Halteromyces radiatus]|uniref:Aspartate/glutamate/uridylate kinase n=1 Tax=Halteromyces radiatus TaxID=101107 RepID=UPI0022211833|nr:Aspartate/glutamate/uridylate kinase [Halteromyces radiatus]KAI8088637.1 Aspartate/glutamate/uridylate kinase [Halteromyces radiatus]